MMAIKFDGKTYAGASDLYLDGFRAGRNAARMDMSESLEMLRDDVDSLLRDCACDTDTADSIERRFTAIIERGA